MKKMRGTKAFTLIELLVVIAIIALLMGILLPTLRKARASAWKATCGAHLHQIAVALEVYEMRYDDKRFAVRNNASETDLYWMGKLADFLGGAEYGKQFREGETIDVLLCPAAPASRYLRDPARKINEPGHTNSYWGMNDRPWEWGRSSGLSTLSSFTINGWLVYDFLYPDTAGNFTNWLNVRPEVPLFGDGLWSIGWPRGTDLDWPDLKDLRGSVADSTLLLNNDKHMWRFCIDRHSRKVNLIFKDLHVEAIGLENLWELPWHRNYKPPTSPIRLP